MGVLLQHFEDARTAPITRAAACAYLASFLARGKFVPRESVLRVLQVLVGWAGAYAGRHGARGARPPPGRPGSAGGDARHQLFFSAVQTVLYILCYHLEPLMQQRVRAAPLLGHESRALGGASFTPMLGFTPIP